MVETLRRGDSTTGGIEHASRRTCLRDRCWTGAPPATLLREWRFQAEPSMMTEKLRRHHAFLQQASTDRPLIGSWLFGFYVHQQYPSVAAAMQPGPVRARRHPHRPVSTRCRCLVGSLQRSGRRLSVLDGRLLRRAVDGSDHGLPGILLRHQPVRCPCIQDWQDYTWQRPTLENPWAQKLLEFLDALVKHAGGRFACGPTLIRGPADICSAIRGGTELALDLYDHPDNVRRLAALSADVWIEVGKAQLALVPESDSGYMVGCAGLRCWMPRKGDLAPGRCHLAALAPLLS